MPVYRGTRPLRAFRTYGRGGRRRRYPTVMGESGRRSAMQVATIRRVPLASNHFFKRSFINSVNTTAGVLPIGKVFSLSQLGGVSELKALFDQFRINCVVVKVIWRSTGVSQFETADDATHPGAPILTDVIDLDNGSQPADRQEIMEYGKHHVTAFSSVKRVRKLKIYPRNLNTIYRTGVSNAYALANKGIWIDMANDDAEYYGYRGFIDVPYATAPTRQAYFDIVYTYYFQCRQSR